MECASMTCATSAADHHRGADTKVLKEFIDEISQSIRSHHWSSWICGATGRYSEWRLTTSDAQMQLRRCSRLLCNLCSNFIAHSMHVLRRSHTLNIHFSFDVFVSALMQQAPPTSEIDQLIDNNKDRRPAQVVVMYRAVTKTDQNNSENTWNKKWRRFVCTRRR